MGKSDTCTLSRYICLSCPCGGDPHVWWQPALHKEPGPIPGSRQPRCIKPLQLYAAAVCGCCYRMDRQVMQTLSDMVISMPMVPTQGTSMGSHFKRLMSACDMKDSAGRTHCRPTVAVMSMLAAYAVSHLLLTYARDVDSSTPRHATWQTCGTHFGAGVHNNAVHPSTPPPPG
jgi:hypothetical protein